jgi:hypothetical protein
MRVSRWVAVSVLTVAVPSFTSRLFAETIRIPVKRPGAGPLYQTHRKEKWGFVDRSGKTVIEPRFDDERDFFHGLAAVRIDGKWGYIDLQGTVVIDPHFDEVRDFLDELAPVRIGRKWGYINTGGRIVIQPRFQAAAEFHEGLARVHIWSKVTCSGGAYTEETAPEWAFHLLEDDHSDLPGCFPMGGHFGFIDKSGSLVIESRFFVAQDFSEGLAAVRLEESATSKYGYINHRGSFVIKSTFNQASRFSQGLAAVETSARVVGNQAVDIAWGFVDSSGALAIPPKYEFAGTFSEGLARVEIQPGHRWGYVDRAGKMAIASEFETATDFSDGLAVVSSSLRGYIDHSGKLIITDERAWWPFADGLAVLGMTTNRVYINKQGQTIAPYDIQQ